MSWIAKLLGRKKFEATVVEFMASQQKINSRIIGILEKMVGITPPDEPKQNG